LTGDVSYLDGEVTAVDYDRKSSRPLVNIRVSMTNQLGALLAVGDVQALLPSESDPAPE
jgi:hypothetical protein